MHETLFTWCRTTSKVRAIISSRYSTKHNHVLLKLGNYAQRARHEADHHLGVPLIIRGATTSNAQCIHNSHIRKRDSVCNALTANPASFKPTAPSSSRTVQRCKALDTFMYNTCDAPGPRVFLHPSVAFSFHCMQCMLCTVAHNCVLLIYITAMHLTQYSNDIQHMQYPHYTQLLAQTLLKSQTFSLIQATKDYRGMIAVASIHDSEWITDSRVSQCEIRLRCVLHFSTPPYRFWALINTVSFLAMAKERQSSDIWLLYMSEERMQCITTVVFFSRRET